MLRTILDTAEEHCSERPKRVRTIPVRGRNTLWLSRLLLLLILCSCGRTQPPPASARKLDFLTTRLNVASGSSRDAAERSERALQELKSLHFEIDLLRDDVEAALKNVSRGEARLKKF